MIVRNITANRLLVSDMTHPDNAAVSLILVPSVNTTLYNEDAEKSKALRKFIEDSLVEIVSRDDEPSSETVVGDSSSKLVDSILSSDKQVQFVTDGNDIASADPEIYTAVHAVAKEVRLVITNANDSRDYANSVTTCLITASGGTVNGLSLDTVTFVDGLATVSVLRATAGNVNLTLSDFTHPLFTSVPPVELAAGQAAQVQFS